MPTSWSRFLTHRLILAVFSLTIAPSDDVSESGEFSFDITLRKSQMSTNIDSLRIRCKADKLQFNALFQRVKSIQSLNKNSELIKEIINRFWHYHVI